MIGSLIHFIQIHLLPLGGAGVFVASVIEEIVAPIPSAVIIFASGFLLVSGPVNMDSMLQLLVKVAIPAALGVTIGSLFAYFVAFFIGKPILVKWGKWFGLSWDDIEKLHQKFSKSSFDELSLFIVRAIPIVPSVVISAFCGLIRFPLRSYLIYSFAGLLVRTTILGFVGWQIGKFYFQYAKVIALFENFILAAIVIAALVFIGWRIQAHRNRPK